MSGIPRTSKIEKKRHDYVVTVSFSSPVTEHEGKFMLQAMLDRIDNQAQSACYGTKEVYLNTFRTKSLHQVMKYLNRDIVRRAHNTWLALVDMRAGWHYIRQAHGDLYGVGWDRCDTKAQDAIIEWRNNYPK